MFWSYYKTHSHTQTNTRIITGRRTTMATTKSNSFNRQYKQNLWIALSPSHHQRKQIYTQSTHRKIIILWSKYILSGIGTCFTKAEEVVIMSEFIHTNLSYQCNKIIPAFSKSELHSTLTSRKYTPHPTSP